MRIFALVVLAAFLAGEETLERRVAEEEAAEQARAQLTERMLLDAAPEPPEDWLRARRRSYDEDVAALEPIVMNLALNMTGGTVIDRDLRGFLERPDAARRLYETFLRPHLGRSPVSIAAGGCVFRRDDGRLHVPPGFRENAKDVLNRCEARDGKLEDVRKALVERHTETGVEEMREDGRSIARRLAPGDELTERWRKRLTGEGVLILASLAKEKVKPDLGKVLLDHTRFGRCLVWNAGSAVSVNRHTYFEMAALLEDLTAPPMALAGTPIIAEMAKLRVKGLKLEGENAVEVDPDRVKRIRAELTAEGSELTLPLFDLPYDSADLDLFRSQVFYNPRTGAGHYLYTAEFPDHPIARLFGTFGWTAKTTGSVEEFLAKIDQRVPALRQLAKTHDKLIVLINTMPPWLSASNDPGSFEGERRENREAHPPKDWEVWRKMIRGMVVRLAAIEDVEWYYEFWNEPDLQYWQAGLEPFLRLYEETAGTIKAADPDAKVGGCAPNQWEGKLRKAKDRDPVNLELIRFAAKRKLPLDFVSWHVFGRPVTAIAEAKQRYTEEFAACGVTDPPEFLVTEWSVPYRGTAYAPAHMAERLVAFREAGVDGQMIACWEEFHRKPDPKHFPPWGMLTQQGHRKPSYYVHRFFDRIARGSEGVAVVRDEAGGWNAVVSKKADHVYDMVVWKSGLESRFRAALDILKEGSLTAEVGKRYTSYDRLERAIVEGKPVPKGLEESFAAAKKAYDAHPVKTPRLVLSLDGAKAAEVSFAESVRMRHGTKRPTVLGIRITCPLRPYEVLHLTIRATPQEE